ncbi:MAG: hypothetical protein GX805_02945, partial [Gammaproteobacteria bacterium]|nr:hypothetical protein [Gammaproteobacteria bacterium]
HQPCLRGYQLGGLPGGARRLVEGDFRQASALPAVGVSRCGCSGRRLRRTARGEDQQCCQHTGHGDVAWALRR